MPRRESVEVSVRIPGALRSLAGGRREARVRGATVGEALGGLAERYPGLRPRLRDESGRLRPSVLIFLNSVDIRSREGEQSALGGGDEIDIVLVADGG